MTINTLDMLIVPIEIKHETPFGKSANDNYYVFLFFFIFFLKNRFRTEIHLVNNFIFYISGTNFGVEIDLKQK